MDFLKEYFLLTNLSSIWFKMSSAVSWWWDIILLFYDCLVKCFVIFNYACIYKSKYTVMKWLIFGYIIFMNNKVLWHLQNMNVVLKNTKIDVTSKPPIIDIRPQERENCSKDFVFFHFRRFFTKRLLDLVFIFFLDFIQITWKEKNKVKVKFNPITFYQWLSRIW